MRSGNPIFILSIWIGVGIWAALEGHWEVLILLAGYILFLVLPFGIGWLWKRIRPKRPN
jgi:hypothetical protein